MALHIDSTCTRCVCVYEKNDHFTHKFNFIILVSSESIGKATPKKASVSTNIVKILRVGRPSFFLPSAPAVVETEWRHSAMDSDVSDVEKRPYSIGKGDVSTHACTWTMLRSPLHMHVLCVYASIHKVSCGGMKKFAVGPSKCSR